jgi:endonuclease III
MTKDQIFEFFRRLAEDNPSPETELEYGNAYQLLVAVALSAQATDVGVNKATRALFAKVRPRSRCSIWARRASRSTSRPSACSIPRRRT